MGSMASAFIAETSGSWTGGDLSASLSEIWIKERLTALYPDLQMHLIPRFGGPGAWKQVPAKKGKKIHFNRLPVLAANTTALTATADDPAAVTATEEGVTALIEEYGDFMVIGDEADDYTMHGGFEGAKEMLAYRALRSFDALIYAEIKGTAATTAATEDGDTLVASASISAEANHGATVANLEYMAFYMKNANVRVYVDGPARGSYLYIAHPYAVKSIRSSTATNSYVDQAKNIGAEIGRMALESMFVGRVNGLSVFETTEIVTAATDAATTSYAYQNILAGYESVGAVGLTGGSGTARPDGGTGKLFNKPRRTFRGNAELIVNPIGSGRTSDPLRRRGTVGYKFRTAIKLLDPTRVRTHAVFGGAA